MGIMRFRGEIRKQTEYGRQKTGLAVGCHGRGGNQTLRRQVLFSLLSSVSCLLFLELLEEPIERVPCVIGVSRGGWSVVYGGRRRRGGRAGRAIARYRHPRGKQRA